MPWSRGGTQKRHWGKEATELLLTDPSERRLTGVPASSAQMPQTARRMERGLFLMCICVCVHLHCVWHMYVFILVCVCMRSHSHAPVHMEASEATVSLSRFFPPYFLRHSFSPNQEPVGSVRTGGQQSQVSAWLLRPQPRG